MQTKYSRLTSLALNVLLRLQLHISSLVMCCEGWGRANSEADWASISPYSSQSWSFSLLSFHCPFLCGKSVEQAWVPVDSMRSDVFSFTSAKVGMSTNPEGLNGASFGVSLPWESWGQLLLHCTLCFNRCGRILALFLYIFFFFFYKQCADIPTLKLPSVTIKHNIT